MNIKKLFLIIPIAILCYLGFYILKQFAAETYYHTYPSTQKKNKNNYRDSELLDRLNKAIDLDSSNAEYHYRIGKIYARMALETLKRGTRKTKERETALEVGPETWELGELAVKHYLSAGRLNPAHAPTHINLAWILSQMAALNPLHTISPLIDEKKKFISCSLDHLKIALSLSPTNAFINYKAGRYCLRYSELLKHNGFFIADTEFFAFNKAMQLDHKYILPIFTAVWDQGGRYESLKKITPDTPYYRLQLYRFLTKKGFTKEADKELKRIEKLKKIFNRDKNRDKD